METTRKLEALVGGSWHEVSVFGLDVKCKEEFLCPHVERFCEAIEVAWVHKVLLDPCQFTCPGARYAFGCGNDLKESMTQRLVEERGYPSEYAQAMIEETPHCETKPGAIGINLGNEPNVLIAQLQPNQAMHLVRAYQTKFSKVYRTEISSVISACGNVTVKAFQTNDMAISFGCDDSRKFGSITRDRLYAGLPYHMAEELVRA